MTTINPNLNTSNATSYTMPSTPATFCAGPDGGLEAAIVFLDKLSGEQRQLAKLGRDAAQDQAKSAADKQKKMAKRSMIMGAILSVASMALNMFTQFGKASDAVKKNVNDVAGWVMKGVQLLSSIFDQKGAKKVNQSSENAQEGIADASSLSRSATETQQKAKQAHRVIDEKASAEVQSLGANIIG